MTIPTTLDACLDEIHAICERSVSDSKRLQALAEQVARLTVGEAIPEVDWRDSERKYYKCTTCHSETSVMYKQDHPADCAVCLGRMARIH